jgi:ABC-type multidrug transport system ATPase subunit
LNETFLRNLSLSHFIDKLQDLPNIYISLHSVCSSCFVHFSEYHFDDSPSKFPLMAHVKLVVCRRVRHPLLLIFEVLFTSLLIFFICWNKSVADVDPCPRPPISLFTSGTFRMAHEGFCHVTDRQCGKSTKTSHFRNFVCSGNATSSGTLHVHIPSAYEMNCSATFANISNHMEHEERHFMKFLLQGKVVVLSEWTIIKRVIQSHKHSMDDFFRMSFSKYGLDHRKMKRTCQRIQTNKRLDPLMKNLCEWSQNTHEPVVKNTLFMMRFMAVCQPFSHERFIYTKNEDHFRRETYFLRKRGLLLGAMEIPIPKGKQLKLIRRLEPSRPSLHKEASQWVGNMLALDASTRFVRQGTNWHHSFPESVKMSQIPPPCHREDKKTCQLHWLAHFPLLMTVGRLPTVAYFAIVAHFEFSNNYEGHLIGFTKFKMQLLHGLSVFVELILSLSIYSLSLLVISVATMLPHTQLIYLWFLMTLFILSIAIQFVWIAPVLLHMFSERWKFILSSVILFLIFYFPALCKDVAPEIEMSRPLRIASFLFPPTTFSMALHVISHFEETGETLNQSTLYKSIERGKDIHFARFLINLIWFSVCSCVVGVFIRIITKGKRHESTFEYGQTLPPRENETFEYTPCEQNSLISNSSTFIMNLQNVTEMEENYYIFGNMSLQVMPNSMVCLAGLSEIRVSYLFDYICGTRTPPQGQIHINLPRRDNSISNFQFQSRWINTAPELSVEENVYFLAALKGLKKSKIEVFVNMALNLLGLNDMKKEKLNNGHQCFNVKTQLIATFAGNGSLYLLDHPTRNVLSIKDKRQIWQFLQWNMIHRNLTIVIATNDLEEARVLSSHFLIFSNLNFVDLGSWRSTTQSENVGVNIIFQLDIHSNNYQDAVFYVTNKVTQYFYTSFLLPKLCAGELLIFFIPQPIETNTLCEMIDDLNMTMQEFDVKAFYFHVPSLQEMTLNALYPSCSSNDTRYNLYMSYITHNRDWPKPPLLSDFLRMAEFGRVGRNKRNVVSQTDKNSFLGWLKDQKKQKGQLNESLQSTEPTTVSTKKIELKTSLKYESLHFRLIRVSHLFRTLKYCVLSHLRELRCVSCTLGYLFLPLALLLLIVTSNKTYKTIETEEISFKDVLQLSLKNNLSLFVQQNVGQLSISGTLITPKTDPRLLFIAKRGISAFSISKCHKKECQWIHENLCGNQCYVGSLFATEPKDISHNVSDSGACNCRQLSECQSFESDPPHTTVGGKMRMYDLTYRDLETWMRKHENNHSDLLYGMQLYSEFDKKSMHTKCKVLPRNILLTNLCHSLYYQQGTKGYSVNLWYTEGKEESAMLVLMSYHHLLLQMREEKSNKPGGSFLVTNKGMYHSSFDMIYQVEMMFYLTFLPAVSVTIFLIWIATFQLQRVIHHRRSSLCHIHFIYQGTEMYYWICNILTDSLHFLFLVGAMSVTMVAFGPHVYVLRSSFHSFVILSLEYGVSTLLYGYLWTHIGPSSDHWHFRRLFSWMWRSVVATISTIFWYHVHLNSSVNVSKLVWIVFSCCSPEFCLLHGLCTLSHFSFVWREATEFGAKQPSAISSSFCGFHIFVLCGHVLFSMLSLWIYRTRGAYLSTWSRHKTFLSLYLKVENVIRNRMSNNASNSTESPNELMHTHNAVFAMIDVHPPHPNTSTKFLTLTKSVPVLSKLVTKCCHLQQGQSGHNILVKKGSLVGVVGSRHSGKSCILRMLTGIDQPSAGRCFAFGNDISIYGVWTLGDVAYCPSNDEWIHGSQLVDVFKYFSSILFDPDRVDTGQYNWMRDVLTHLNLDEADIAKREPSNSLRRKVSIAVTLMLRRPVILFDEPFAFMRDEEKLQLKYLFHHLKTKYRATIVLTSLNLSDCEDICDTIYLLHPQRGSVGGKSIQQLFTTTVDGYFVECFLGRNLHKRIINVTLCEGALSLVNR